MWTKKRSSSPISSIGEASAANTSAIPLQNASRRHRGTGVPRTASVRTRRPYSTATAIVGTNWSGSRFHWPSIARSLPITGEHPPLGGEVRAQRRLVGDKKTVASFEQRVAAEAEAWAEEGLVSREQAAAIAARYVDTERVLRRDRFVQTLAFVGAIG